MVHCNTSAEVALEEKQLLLKEEKKIEKKENTLRYSKRSTFELFLKPDSGKRLEIALIIKYQTGSKFKAKPIVWEL